VPFDCGTSFTDQLQKAHANGINALFVTNHNTTDGYHQILEFKNNHAKYNNLKIYPAEEITIADEGHVLAYGIREEIEAGMSLEETLDRIKSQNGLSCAAHPFAVSNGIREKAVLCDLIESFNSNNVDRISNLVARQFATENQLLQVAGSDSHIPSTIARCTNSLECENNLDCILESMRAGKVSIEKSEYITRDELFEHAHYVLSSSKESILREALRRYPRFYKTARWALNYYASNPDNPIWRALGALGLYLTKRVSEKVNLKGHDPHIFRKRSWKNLIAISLEP
jgi:predicted metal-dependent phosphoesterase TrpH